MKKLLLVGGGHAHLYVIKKLKESPIKDVEITLISPSRYQYYSGMFSGYTEGLYDKSQISINLEALAKTSNVRWLQGAVTAIDPQQKVALTSNGEIVSFDALSFDIGSLTAGVNTPGVAGNSYRIKPNYHFVDVIDEVRKADKIVIVGGGAAGIEISLSLNAWRNQNGIKSPITLISAGRLLQQKRKGISEKIEAIVIQKGINLKTAETVAAVKKDIVITASNKNFNFDKLIWLTGPKAPGLFKASRLPVDDKGYLSVEDTLQVKQYPFIFGAGDCVSLVDYPNIDKAGVYAVKQGSILFKNLKGFFESGEGERYIPQKEYLSILSLGNKEGFLLYRDRSFTGRWAWYLKNRIDTNFVKQYKC